MGRRKPSCDTVYFAMISAFESNKTASLCDATLPLLRVDKTSSARGRVPRASTVRGVAANFSNSEDAFSFRVKGLTESSAIADPMKDRCMRINGAKIRKRLTISPTAE